MAQLLVRNLDEALVSKLKGRAARHGVSAEEEHRCILKEALLKPQSKMPALMEYLLSEEGEVLPQVDLEITRCRDVETRETGL